MTKLVTEDTLYKVAILLKAVSHPIRLQIVNILMNGECHVGELERVLGTTQSTTSQQLNNLKYAGVVKSRKDGNKVYYSLANDSIKKIVKSIIKEFDKIS